MAAPGTDAAANWDPPKGFWKRQFAEEPTRKQLAFDLVFGTLLPLICVVADPIVFNDWMEGGFLYNGRITGWGTITSGALVSALWWFRDRHREAPGWAGAFITYTVFSLALGLVMSPFSLLGILFFGIGCLGFTPFATGFAFLRAAIRALRGLRGRWGWAAPRIFAGAWIASIFLFINVAVYWRCNRAAERIERDFAAPTEADLALLRRWRFFYAPKRWWDDWNQASGPDQDRIWSLYTEIMGKEPEWMID